MPSARRASATVTVIGSKAASLFVTAPHCSHLYVPVLGEEWRFLDRNLVNNSGDVHTEFFSMYSAQCR